MARSSASIGAALRTRLRPGDEAWRRMGIVLRIVAAAGGGYVVAALFTAALSVGLPLPRAEAVLTATLGSFVVYAGAVVWAFAVRGVFRAWAGMAGAAAVLAVLLLLLQGRAP